MDKMQELKEWVGAQVDSVYSEDSVRFKDYRGLPHITFTCGGVKTQEEPLELLSEESEAIEAFKTEFLLYLKKQEGVKILQWRMHPKIVREDFFYGIDATEFKTLYGICARFSIAPDLPLYDFNLEGG